MTGSDATTQQIGSPRYFYGWVIAGAAFASNLLSYGAPVVAFGIFFPYMAESLGWSRSLLSSVTVVSRLTSAPAALLIGPMVDRRGPRLITFLGAICLALGAFLLAASDSVWMVFLSYGLIMALGSVALGELSADSTVARWFIRRRSRALVVATMGLSAAGVILPVPLAYLIGRFGWRQAWIYMAVFILVVGIVAALLMRRRPEDYGLSPDGDLPDASSTAHGIKVTEISYTAREAVRTPAFWLMLVSVNLAALALFGVNLHLFSFITDKKVPPEIAASVISYLYLLQSASKPIWGFIAERIHIRFCLASCYLGGAVGILFLMISDSLVGLLAFATVYGLTRGAQSFISSLVWADYFGRNFQGAIRGIASPFRLISTALGPVLGGTLYDATGNYVIAFSVFAATFMLGGLAALVARPPRQPSLAPRSA